MRAYRIIVRSLSLLFAASAAAAALAGCTSSKGPFLMIEVCLKDAAGVSGFKQEMQVVAQSHGMMLVDDSELQESNLDALDKIATPDLRKTIARPVVNMVLRDGDEVMVIVGNIGLPTGQVVVSFFDSSTSLDSHEFADMVVDRLAKKWRIEVVPQGQGAQGIAGCS